MRICGCCFGDLTRWRLWYPCRDAKLTREQQIYHVKAVHDVAALNLDLNRTENEQFPPEKLRMTLERFYTSVIVGVTEFIRHITRLRSWKEPVRTSLFCGVGQFFAGQ